MSANRPNGGVKKKAHVADGQRGDLADFLVREVALEFQVDNLALVRRQVAEDTADPFERLIRVVPLVEVVANRDVVTVKRSHSHGLSTRVQRQVPADGEQPRSDTPVELRWILATQAEKGFLHDVPS